MNFFTRVDWKLAGLLVIMAVFGNERLSQAIESISEPDSIIIGKVYNANVFPAYIVTDGEVEWTIASVDDPNVSFTYRAKIEELSNGEYFYRFTISHEASLSTFRVSDAAIPLGFGDESYSFVEIKVNGIPATIREGADGFHLSQGNRGSINRIDLNIEFDPEDTDGDDIPDWWEILNGLDPDFPDGHLNNDMDDLTNLEEFWLGTDPLRMDSPLDREGELAAGEMDYYRFLIPVPRFVTVSTEGNVDTIGEILDSELNVLNDPQEDDNAGAAPLNFKSTIGLAAGSYWVRVKSRSGAFESGNYTLKIEPEAGLVLPDLRTGNQKNRAITDGNNSHQFSFTAANASRDEDGDLQEGGFEDDLQGRRFGLAHQSKVRGKLKRGATAYLMVENDGDIPDQIRVGSSKLPRKRFRPRFLSAGGGNVYAALIRNSLVYTLEPEERRSIVLRVKLQKSFLKKTKKRRIKSNLFLSAASGYLSQKVDRGLIRFQYR